MASNSTAAWRGASVARRSHGLAHRLWRDRWIYVLLLPTAVLYGAYTLWPIVASDAYGFFHWTGFSASMRWAGTSNFVAVVRDPLFWNAMRITFLFVLVTVPLRVFCALVLAIVLNNPRLPTARWLRTGFFLPVVTTSAIVGVVMSLIFDPVSGPVDLLLLKTGLIHKPLEILGNAHTALWAVMAVWIWKWLGITMIYWLASLQTIPGELYEAARIDGAGAGRIFRHLTVPLLIPFLVIITLLTAIEALQVFDLMLTMTGGGPYYATQVVEIYVYDWAFNVSVPQLGYASAAATIFGLVTLILAIGQGAAVRAIRRRALG
ncbi:MAG: sugar ABC transporter permease [Candidatus Dormibacteraeota bacterium]|nr:sugar ABC transporter permease [Candidatus Dormibacteraeota bacterium]MBO0743526.1 sugar ABC transporter permease [Candidatus Dormibacteraeota bacterium]